jgi:hypothetical protein
VILGAIASSCSKLRLHGSRARPRAAFAVLLSLLAVALAPAPAGAASAAKIIALLNAQRAANGIPAGITDSATWSAACAMHDAYEHANDVFGHVETAGKPDFTSEGEEIAQTSVLAEGVYWGPGDPYENAPYHLFDLFNPRIASTGAADSEGFGCVEIELGTVRRPPARVTAYSYPGDHRTGVPYSQRAQEQPMTPAETVGLGKHATGPNMFVYFDGPWTNGSRAMLTTATMFSSAGAVPLRWIDNTSSDLLAPTGAILVPTAPLRPATTYHVRAEGSVTGVLPGTTIEQALGGCQQSGEGVECGQPPSTDCVENFATQLAVCGLAHTWAVRDQFTFTTAPRAGSSH